ncbi:hypothetical protein CTEN210_05295 [Chaetoceros tenuissimus]|uniref:Uncharacterized protein n=1 Tax=Chaetoceros tenuissimus TaxID=426638 RepID=A0AAD3CN68_9STRA|nr:hypothetical protein CTEN210_05295 [Chaetoceros tenuissimus]
MIRICSLPLFSTFLFLLLWNLESCNGLPSISLPRKSPLATTTSLYAGLSNSRREVLAVTGIASASIFATSELASASDIVANPKTFTPKLVEALEVATNPTAGQFCFPALTPPFNKRATYRYTLGRNAWAFEQLLTFSNVTATIRSNVIKLESGGLWVNSPQFPTGELCALLDDLNAPVEHIVLPCNAFEHKAPMKPFTRRYPDAKVWVSPGQYGVLGTCGKSLEERFTKKSGPTSEVAFCHRPTRTLVATDSVIFVNDAAPDIFKTYFEESTVGDETFWPRTVLQAVFLPLRQDDNNMYPGYESIKNRLVRAPILRALVDARAPNEVKSWIETQTTWDFDRIITSHFASPIAATPDNFRSAFDYLFEEEEKNIDSSIKCQDWNLLDSINKFVAKTNAGAPATFDFTRGCSR